MKNILLLFSMLFISFVTFAQKADNYLLIYSEEDTTLGYEVYGYKTPAGKIIIRAKYILAATDTMRKMAFVTKDGAWVGIDRNEKIILRAFNFDNGPDYVVEGLFRFEENNKMGFANLDGKKVIPAVFDFITPFENGFAEYTLGGYKEYDACGEHWVWVGGYETGYINKSGKRFKTLNDVRKKSTP